MAALFMFWAMLKSMFTLSFTLMVFWASLCRNSPSPPYIVVMRYSPPAKLIGMLAIPLSSVVVLYVSPFMMNWISIFAIASPLLFVKVIENVSPLKSSVVKSCVWILVVITSIVNESSLLVELNISVFVMLTFTS